MRIRITVARVTGLQRAGVLSLGVAEGGYCFRSCPVSRLSLKSICRGVSMTVSRFVLDDFRYTSDPLGHIRLYEAGNIYDNAPNAGPCCCEARPCCGTAPRRRFSRPRTPIQPPVLSLGGGV